MNPDMVKLARRAINLTQADLADRLGIAQPLISCFEGGISDAPVPVEQMARALQVPVLLLQRHDDVHDTSKAINHYRKKSSVGAGILHMAHARINIARIRIARILDEIELDSPCRFTELKVQGEEQTPEMIAKSVRQDWQLPSGPVASVIGSIERAGGIVVPLDFGCDEIDAVHHRCPGLPPIFFYNPTKPTDRMRFSLAHEIGHTVMHAISSDAMEEEANAFAAGFLMPDDDIRDELIENTTIRNLPHLKRRWNASMMAIIFRAQQLGAIGDKRASNLFIEMSKAGWRTKEPFLLPPESPSLLRTICDTYMRGNGITIEDLATIAMCNVEDIEAMIYPDRRKTGIIQFPQAHLKKAP